MDVLLALNLLGQQLEELFKMVIKVFLDSVHHSLVIVFHDALPDIFTLQFNSLLPSSDCIHQMVAIVVGNLVSEVGLVLIHNVHIFPQEVIHFILVSVSSIVLLAGAGEESDDDPRKEMRS